MKTSVLVLFLVILVNAEITSEQEYVRAVNTPGPYNNCMGGRLDSGHDSEFRACVRKYFPDCHGLKTNIYTFGCMLRKKPQNITQKDKQRQQQIEEWRNTHVRPSSGSR